MIKKPEPKDKVFWQTSEKIEKQIIAVRKNTNYGPKRIKVELEILGIKTV